MSSILPGSSRVPKDGKRAKIVVERVYHDDSWNSQWRYEYTVTLDGNLVQSGYVYEKERFARRKAIHEAHKYLNRKLKEIVYEKEWVI